MGSLKDKKIAILTEEGFEQEELTSPREALEKEGATVEILSPEKRKIKAWNHTDWGIEIDVDKAVEDAIIDDYDALVLPGGVLNPDKLRLNATAVRFTKKFMESGKPVAAICHGPQTLIETGLLEGKTMTSFPSVRTDLENAGVIWVDKEIVHDENLITSRKPSDLVYFNAELVKTLVNGKK